MNDALTIETASELTGRPSVGRTYLVPTVTVAEFGSVLHWPVWGGAHADDPPPQGHSPLFYDPSFTTLEKSRRHYHVDPRFITEEQERRLGEMWRQMSATLRAANGPRVAIGDSAQSDGIKGALCLAMFELDHEPLKASLMPWECRYETIEWDAPPRDHYLPVKDVLWRFEGKTPRAVISPDGRPTCPHQRFDLTAVWDGKSETVRCPLHGLEVDMSQCLRSSRSSSSDFVPVQPETENDMPNEETDSLDLEDGEPFHLEDDETTLDLAE